MENYGEDLFNYYIALGNQLDSGTDGAFLYATDPTSPFAPARRMSNVSLREVDGWGKVLVYNPPWNPFDASTPFYRYPPNDCFVLSNDGQDNVIERLSMLSRGMDTFY